MGTRAIRGVCAVLALAVLLAGCGGKGGGGGGVVAPTTAGSIAGVISEVSLQRAPGPTVAGVSVRCLDVSATSDAAGRYLIQGIASGTRSITFSSPDFDQETASVEVKAGQTTTRDVQLKRRTLSASSGNYKLAPGATVLPNDGSVALADVGPDTVTLQGAVPPLAVGTTIASSAGEGFLRKVVAVNHQGAAVVVDTEPAYVFDLLQECSVKVDSAPASYLFEPAAGVKVLNGTPSTRSVSGRASFDVNATEVNLDISESLKLALFEGFGAGGSATGKLTFSVPVKGELNLERSLSLPFVSIKQFRTSVGLKAKLAATAKITGDVTASLVKKEVKLGTVRAIAPIFLGPIPLWPSATLKLVTESTLSVQRGMEFTVDSSYNAELGGEYREETGWQLIQSSPEQGASADSQVSTEKKVDFNLFVGEEASVKLKAFNFAGLGAFLRIGDETTVAVALTRTPGKYDQISGTIDNVVKLEGGPDFSIGFFSDNLTLNYRPASLAISGRVFPFPITYSKYLNGGVPITIH